MRRWHFPFGLILLAGISVFAASSATPATTVRTDAGQVSGQTDSNGVTTYLGIPYAAPPVGQLRWRPPQPVTPWKDVRQADKFGDSCMQIKQGSRLPWTDAFMVQNAISEDCLYLNVWTTAAGTTKKLPVMFWIHGGGNSEGSGDVAIYNGKNLAREDVVVVTINYRLGPLGFLAHPALTSESPNHASGNYGILDQIAALKWVHKNIAAFGGDPSNITVFGQSAGAGDTTILMASPLAQDLFTHAITESGSGRRVPAAGRTSLAQAEQKGEKYAGIMNAHSLVELRALPASDFAKLVPGATLSSLGFGPVIDNWVIPEAIPAHQVPLINGMNADDLGIGIDYGNGQAPPPTTMQSYNAQMKEICGAEADTCLKLYPAKSEEEAGLALRTALRDRARVAVDMWSIDQAKRGPLYSYYFDHPEPWPEHPQFGTFHTSEVPYVFNTLNTVGHPFTAEDDKISDRMSSYWANFAKTGNPNGTGLADWPQFNPDNRTTMELGSRMGPIPAASSPERLNFWLNHLK
jgi:para-nitrobenzyl esterase